MDFIARLNSIALHSVQMKYQPADCPSVCSVVVNLCNIPALTHHVQERSCFLAVRRSSGPLAQIQLSQCNKRISLNPHLPHLYCCCILMAENVTSAMCSDKFEALGFPVRAALAALMALYWLTAGTANTFNVVIMGKLSYHFPTWPSLTICFLSAADFVTVVAGLLPTVVATAWKGPLLCEYPELCDFQGFFLTMTFLASFCLLALISFDRFTAICCPFCYNKHIARNRPMACRSLFAAVGILFLFCSLAASITFMLGHRMTVHYPGWYCAFDWRGNDWATFIPCSVHAGVSIMVVIVLGGFTFAIIVAVARMKRNAAHLKMCGKAATKRVRGVESGAPVPKTRRVHLSRQRNLETVFARVAITTTTVHTLLGLPFIVSACTAVVATLCYIHTTDAA